MGGRGRGLVLLVEDEPLIVDFLRTGLAYEGFTVEAAQDGVTALRLVQALHPDVIILDRMLPMLEGTEVCRRLRQDGVDVPILMLTARGTIDDRVVGLDAGADDYVVKPFAFKELLARLRAMLRRREPREKDAVQVGPLYLNVVAREVRLRNQEIVLTPREFDLLELFMRHPRQVFTREAILNHVWGYDFAGDRNLVDVYIGYLRRKLGDSSGELIRTVRGVGYSLRASEE